MTEMTVISSVPLPESVGKKNLLNNIIEIANGQSEAASLFLEVNDDGQKKGAVIALNYSKMSEEALDAFEQFAALISP